MDQQQQLRWVPKPHVQAERITEKEWETHRKEICELYERMELVDVMKFMKIRRSFAPNKRQYVHKLGKWNIKKHKSNLGSPSLISPSNTAIGSPIAGPSAVYSTSMVLAKRHHSTLSLQSKISDGSGGRPAVPPKKKEKLAEFMATKDPYADLGLAFDNPKSIADPKGKGKAPMDMSRRSIESVDMCISSQAGPSNARPYWVDEDEVDSDDAEEIYEEANPFLDRRRGDWETIITISSDDEDYYSDAISEYNLNSSGVSTPRGPNEQSRVESSRPIESFTKVELQHMKAAADLLLALKFDRQAFHLYALLYKRLKMLADPPVDEIVGALLACARSATTKSQVDIAQHLLEDALVEAVSIKHEATTFVFRMLLADTFTRIRKYPAAVSHVERAWRSALAHPDFFSSLPEDYRSLDFLFFHYALRTLGSLEYVAIEGGFSENLYGEKRTLPFEAEIQESILRREPGPFQLKDDMLQNPCIRSCLWWCHIVLEEDNNESGAWKRFLEESHLEPWIVGEESDSLKAHEMSTRQIGNIRRAMTFGLTVHLWQKLQAGAGRLAGEWGMIWAKQSEVLMGISPAELLEALCQLMIDASLEREFKSTLILQAREGADYLLGLPDRELASSIMDCFSRMAYAGPTFSDRYDSEKSGSKKGKKVKGTINYEISDDKIYRQLTRPYVILLIESTFCIELPELHKPDFDKDINQPATFGDACRVYADTFAGSLTSDEDLIALRNLKKKIAEGFAGAKDAVMTAPSAMMRDARSSASVPSLDEALSQMASTLSLSAQQATNSTASLLANVSEGVRNGSWGTGGLGYRQRLSG